MKKWFCLIFLYLFFPVGLFAQESVIFRIDDIEVNYQTQEEYHSGETKILSDQNLVESRMSTENVLEELGKQAGIHLNRYGDMGVQSGFSIRGSNQNQVSLFIDGVPMDLAATDVSALGFISLNEVKNIQVYKSFIPNLSASAIGGVISVETEKVKEGFQQDLDFGYGSFNTMHFHTKTSYGTEKHGISLNLSYKRTDGDFKFLDNNGTPLNIADDRVVKRQNNHQEVFAPSLLYEYQLSADQTLSLRSRLMRSHSGVPGLQNFQSQTANYSFLDWVSSIGYEDKNFLTDKQELKNNFYFRFLKAQFSDLNGEIGLGAAQDNDNRSLALGDILQHNWIISDDFIFLQSLEYGFENFLPKDYLSANSIGSESSRHKINLGVGAKWTFLEQKLKVLTNLKGLFAYYDINNNDPSLNNSGTFFSENWENEYAYSLSGHYEFAKNWYVKSSFGRFVRFPKFQELFGDQGYSIGNAALVPETSYKFDVGINGDLHFSKILKNLSLEGNFFLTENNNLIQYEVLNGVAQARNIGESRIYGIELISRFQFEKYFEWINQYSWQQAKDKNTSRFLIGRPLQELNSHVIFKWKKLRLGTDVNWIDKKYLDSLNTQVVRNRIRLDHYVAYIWKKVSLKASLKNSTNSQIVDAVGFPLPGRSFFAELNLKY